MSFLHKNAVNLHTSYTLDAWSRNLNTDFTLGNCLVGAMKLTKNADSDKHGYSGYATGFNSHSQFSWLDGSWGKDVIIVRAEGPTQVFDNTATTAEVKYPINLTELGKAFVLSLHYNGSNSCFYFSMQWKCINLQQKFQK